MDIENRGQWGGLRDNAERLFLTAKILAKTLIFSVPLIVKPGY